MIDSLLIENVCRSVIKEYLGISDEVEMFAREAFRLVMGAYTNSSPWSEVRRGDDTIMLKALTYDIDSLEGTKLISLIDELRVVLYGYDPRTTTLSDYEDYLLGVSKRCGEKSIHFSYTPSINMITIRTPFPIDGDIDGECEEYIMSSLYHEVEHAWQSKKRGGTNISDAYTKSLRKTDFTTDESSSMHLIRYHIKRCYYVFDSGEIDARLHEIWYEVKHGRKIDDSKAYKEVKEAIEGYKWVCRVINSQDSFDKKYYSNERKVFSDTVKDELGLNAPSQWFKYCENGIKKFNEQLRRIMGRHNNTIGYQGNGSFKQYAQGEIPQEELFRIKKENPSLWRKIVNRLKKLGQ